MTALLPPDVAAALSGKRVLIAGGLGFIGSNLARALVAVDARVTIVDALVPTHGGDPANVADVEDRLTIEICDLRQHGEIAQLVREQEVVFNLAGQTSHLDSMSDPFTDLELNCRAQLSLLEACRHGCSGARIVYAGTRQVYGRPRSLPVGEHHPLAPVDVNGVHKIAAERYHELYGRVYEFPVCTLRLTNTYGPRMRVRDARQTFLGVWIAAAAAGEDFDVYGDGSQLRDFTYVDDAVRAFCLAAIHPAAAGEVFNVGGGPPVSLLELAELLVGVTGCGSYRCVPFPGELRRIDIGDYYADDTKLRTRLGWMPQVPLAEGLARTVSFCRERKRLRQGAAA